jgi:hypothetical protein
VIRAMLGGFMLGCIEAAKQRRFDVETRQVDLAKLTDREISDFVHGRKIDWDAVERRIAGSRGIEP